MLEEVRVLDFTRTLTGLFCCMLLTEMGSEVIQVEPTQKEKGSAGSRTSTGHLVDGFDMRFLQMCRNKKSILLNLKDPEAKGVLYDLVRKSDVVLDNNRPQAVERLGIEYDMLKEINPRIISCSITGFKRSGRFKNLPMFDYIAQALSGFWSLSGERGQMPLVSSVPIIDITTGMFAAHGILAALYHRERTGKGQKVETSLLGSSLCLTNYDGVSYLNSGKILEPQGTKLRSGPLFGVFQTKDSYIALCSSSDRFFKSLCGVLSLDHVPDDPQYREREDRVKAKDKLNALIQEELLKWETAPLVKQLSEADVPVAEIVTLDKTFSDPRVIEEDATRTVDWQGRTFKILKSPVRLSELKEHDYKAPPDQGEHTDKILSELLEYPVDKIKRLKEKNVIG